MANPKFPKNAGIIGNVADYSCPTLSDYSGENAKVDQLRDWCDYQQSRVNKGLRELVQLTDPRMAKVGSHFGALAEACMVPYEAP